jgi:hypothetical protein
MGKVKSMAMDQAEELAIDLNISFDMALELVMLGDAAIAEEVRIARKALGVFRDAFWKAKDAGDHEESEHLGAITDGLTDFLIRHDPDHAREMARQNDADLEHILGV